VSPEEALERVREDNSPDYMAFSDPHRVRVLDSGDEVWAFKATTGRQHFQEGVTYWQKIVIPPRGAMTWRNGARVERSAFITETLPWGDRRKSLCISAAGKVE